MCVDRHLPPTGKKCTVQKTNKKIVSDVSGLLNSSISDSTTVDSDSSSEQIVVKKKSVVSSKKAPAGGQNSHVSGANGPGLSSSVEDDQLKMGGSVTGDVQVLILQELRKVSKRLDIVEERIEGQGSSPAGTTHRKGVKLSKNSAQSSDVVVNQKKRSKLVSSSDSSDDELAIPELKVIRSSRSIQKGIDKKLASLQKEKHDQGNDTPKIKSKRGGASDILVNKRVSWPQDHVLGGPTKQRLSYDQLNLTQFVQGFAKNILEESEHDCREKMLHYLAELMEDANDFSWANAKASHAVLMCEMERGVVDWSDTTRIDRIQRAHVQKHNPPHRQNWAKNWDQRKPWFCKPFQSGSCQFGKDHEVNGKTHKHICSYCLTQGRFLGHPEKDCQLKKNSKNEQTAAQH